jgi:hypothetical protein
MPVINQALGINFFIFFEKAGAVKLIYIHSIKTKLKKSIYISLDRKLIQR